MYIFIISTNHPFPKGSKYFHLFSSIVITPNT